MIRLHRLLLLLFIITLLSQVTFTIDLVRTLSGDYPVKPLVLGAPWPTITNLSEPALAAGLRRGDRVIAIEGLAPRGAAEMAQAVRVKHPGDRVAITVSATAGPSIFCPLQPLSIWWSFALIILIFMPWLSILLGFWVAAMRPRDPRAGWCWAFCSA